MCEGDSKSAALVANLPNTEACTYSLACSQLESLTFHLCIHLLAADCWIKKQEPLSVKRSGHTS